MDQIIQRIKIYLLVPKAHSKTFYPQTQISQIPGSYLQLQSAQWSLFYILLEENLTFSYLFIQLSIPTQNFTNEINTTFNQFPCVKPYHFYPTFLPWPAQDPQWTASP